MKIENLPADAQAAIRAWAAARDAAGTLPPVSFAASEIPPHLLPMSMCYRRLADGSYIYSLVGDELAMFLQEDPRGSKVLETAPEAERRQRYEMVDRAIDRGEPFWLASDAKLDDGSTVRVGRLGLPATNGERRVLLLVYFMPEEIDAHRGHKFASFARWDADSVDWIPASAR